MLFTLQGPGPLLLLLQLLLLLLAQMMQVLYGEVACVLLCLFRRVDSPVVAISN